MQGLLVLSMDIVIDPNLGDIGQQTTQKFWLQAIRDGYVVAMLSGPPCFSWSVARGKHDRKLAGQGRPAPRLIRTSEEPWGVFSASLREMYQLHDGHLLLGFSLHAMILLYISGYTGILEHPAEHPDEAAASIWRLPLIRMMLNLAGFELFECAQGLLGADSAKRTGLLALNLSHLPFALQRNALCAELPKLQSIGIGELGHFKTAKLKEYPPAFCRALAEAFHNHFPPRQGEDLPSLPAEFLQTCQKQHCTDFGAHIGRREGVAQTRI